MRKFTLISGLTLSLLVATVGCRTAQKAEIKRPRVVYAADNNPTTMASRGGPSLDDDFRPAAWVLIDGCGGSYKEVDGHPQIQWFTDEPVSSTPTFRVEAYEPLLGKPTNFQCALKSVSTGDDGTGIYYGVKAEEGTFDVGREYSLLAPGDNFVIRDPSGAVVDEIAPLAAGQYLIAAHITNPETEKWALAITYFNVADDD